MTRRMNAAAAGQILFLAITAGASVSCGGDRREEVPSLDSADLSPDERAVAEALLTGYQKEPNAPPASAADVERAACYARHIDMPAEFAKTHRLYLADYAAIDQKFYAWFETNGISMEDAWDIAQRVKQALAACSEP